MLLSLMISAPPTNRGSSEWRATTTISGASSKPESASGPLRRKALFQRVAEHRELFFRFSWVDYSTHKPGTFRLTPPADHLAAWQTDYQAMLGPMFFGDTPTFAQIMAAAAEFEKAFNSSAHNSTFPPIDQ